MDIQYKLYWVLSLIVFFILGLGMAFNNLTPSDYYVTQYKTLSSEISNKPQPIQHYENQRDESVKVTEQNNLAEKQVQQPAANVTITNNILTTEPLNMLSNFTAWLIIIHFAILISGIRYFFDIRLRGTSGLMFSFAIATALTLCNIPSPLYFFFNSFFPTIISNSTITTGVTP